MRRSKVTLHQVADWHNLNRAFRLAARGTRDRQAVACFAENLESNLADLRAQLLDGGYQPLPMQCFPIRDPKPRIIHAPAFRDRVTHHALMAVMGPVLERALVDDTFACRPGKGPLAAVQRVQHHLRRWPWFVQIDMRGYFSNIDHDVLRGQLRRKFKDEDLLRLAERIVGGFHGETRKGLPIGALSSQQFANTYLGEFDRYLSGNADVCGQVRYMDDVFWCCKDRDAARQTLDQARDFLSHRLALNIKPGERIGRSVQGVVFCGFRILPGTILLTRRRKQRYARRRAYWENRFAEGTISAGQLQRAYASVLGLTQPADAAHWRAEQLRRHPVAADVAEVLQ